jgi:hypothetical protein
MSSGEFITLSALKVSATRLPIGANTDAQGLPPRPTQRESQIAEPLRSSSDFRLLVQNHIQQGTVDLNMAVVINQAQSPKFVHEEADACSRRADDLR